MGQAEELQGFDELYDILDELANRGFITTGDSGTFITDRGTEWYDKHYRWAIVLDFLIGVAKQDDQ